MNNNRTDNPLVIDGIDRDSIDRSSIISVDIRSSIENRDGDDNTSKVNSNINADISKLYINSKNNGSGIVAISTIDSTRNVLEDRTLKHSTFRQLYLLATLSDKYFDINTYTVFLKFSIILMTLNVLIYIGINIGVFATAKSENFKGIKIIEVQLGFFIIGAFFELFCIYRSILLLKYFCESNAAYVLLTSLIYVLVIIAAIVDGSYLCYNSFNSSTLIIFIILSTFLFLWQIFTCCISLKLYQYVKYNYDGDSSSRNSSSYKSNLSIPFINN